MDTKRNIIGEVEQMAVNAIVHQPDENNAAEKHFSDVAKKIVETALQAVDVMEVGDVCRRAVTGAAIQDYDLLAKLLTDKDFDHGRLAKAIEDRLLARASEKPIDYPTYFTPGWLVDLAKAMEAGRAVSTKPPTDDELHEAATEAPPPGATGVSPVGADTGATGVSPVGVSALPPGADGTPSAEETQQPELRPVRPQTLDDIGMQMDKRVSRDANGVVVRIDYAGIRHMNGTHPFQIWEIYVAKYETIDHGNASHVTVFRDHERIFSGTAFFGLSQAADVAISIMIRKIIGDTDKKYRERFRRISNASAMTMAAQSGEVA